MDYRPTFKHSLLYPRYWGLWLLLLLLIVVALIPSKWRDPRMAILGRYLGRRCSRPRRRARVNLRYCFPHWTNSYREQIIDEMFSTAAQVSIAMIELVVRSQSYLLQRVRLEGEEHLTRLRQQGKPIILLVPHVWGIDVAAVALAAMGFPVAAMFKPDKNPLINWFLNRARLRFGGRLHARQQGLKPLIQSIRSGYLGYYLPDEDHGADKSELVDFFATYKATLPVIAPLAKACRAEILPLLPIYNTQLRFFELQFFPPLILPEVSRRWEIARKLNQVIEELITPYPAQYLWILKLLKTRKPGESISYDE